MRCDPGNLVRSDRGTTSPRRSRGRSHHAPAGSPAPSPAQCQLAPMFLRVHQARPLSRGSRLICSRDAHAGTTCPGHPGTCRRSLSPGLSRGRSRKSTSPSARRKNESRLHQCSCLGRHHGESEADRDSESTALPLLLHDRDPHLGRFGFQRRHYGLRHVRRMRPIAGESLAARSASASTTGRGSRLHFIDGGGMTRRHGHFYNAFGAKSYRPCEYKTLRLADGLWRVKSARIEKTLQ